jgi:hypothetical protein
MLNNFIPESNYIKQNPTQDREQLRNVFANNLQPDLWQDDSIPERDDLPDDAGGEYTGTCDALRSHCRGMSQYGALGMSQDHYSYEQILKFYYGTVNIVPISTIPNVNPDPQVKIQLDDDDPLCPDGSSINLEDYLTGLGEMPNYWGNASKGGFEALKAQIIAARTYAMMRTGYFNRPICNSSRCQVFRCSNLNADSRANIKRAVEATRGLVLVDSVTLKPFSTEYARSFCGPSREVVYRNVHTNPSVNGIEYERKARNGQEPFCK